MKAIGDYQYLGFAVEITGTFGRVLQWRITLERKLNRSCSNSYITRKAMHVIKPES